LLAQEGKPPVNPQKSQEELGIMAGILGAMVLIVDQSLAPNPAIQMNGMPHGWYLPDGGAG
jgi:hypothetical protein